ncbi:MAG: undecaprenyl-phosphate glucose phosphotransferase [Muribaculaceae bacterium]|nr:undecaprenyl-phosphate glucose phosphotransferase [Muribaculaceae bacterium]
MKTKARYGSMIKWLFSLVDIIILNSTYVVSMLLCGGKMAMNIRLVWLLLNLSYVIVAYFRSDIHDRRVLYADHVAMHALRSVGLHAAIFLSIITFLGIILPLKGLVLFYSLFAVAMVLWWFTSRKVIKLYRNHGFNYRNIIIVGQGGSTHRFVEEVGGDLGYGYRILAIFSNGECDFPRYHHGSIDEVEDFVHNNSVDELYCAVPDSNNGITPKLLRIAEDHAIDFYYVPQLGPTVTRNFSLLTFGNVPVMAVMPHPSQNPFNRFIKRSLDLVVSMVVLALFPFILIPVAIAIKATSPGPIFYRQKRTGYRGKEFWCYKFRTMEANETSDNQHTTRMDPRVTRVGRILRHYSIDELPQVFNVFKGDMSIVGPRPHMVQHTEMYRDLIDKYMLRHVIKPGITGWAQVCGYRGDIDELWKMEKRVECDVWYTENWNFMLDIKIILLTVYKAFKGDQNAY